jgi:hypothetical protein
LAALPPVHRIKPYKTHKKGACPSLPFPLRKQLCYKSATSCAQRAFWRYKTQKNHTARPRSCKAGRIISECAAIHSMWPIESVSALKGKRTSGRPLWSWVPFHEECPGHILLSFRRKGLTSKAEKKEDKWGAMI